MTGPSNTTGSTPPKTKVAKQPAKKKKPDRSEMWIKILGVAAAVLAIVAGVIAVKAAGYNRDAANANKDAALAKNSAQVANSVVQTLQTAVSGLQNSQVQNSDALKSASSQLQSYEVAKSSLQSQLFQASADNKALSSSLAQATRPTQPANATTSSTQSSPTVSGKVRYTGPLNLHTYDSTGTDLDNLGTQESGQPDIGLVGNFNGYVVASEFVSSIKLLNDGKPTKGSLSLCGDQDYSTDNIDYTKLQTGSAICVLTDEHRVAVLQLVTIDIQGATFTVTTYS